VTVREDRAVEIVLVVEIDQDPAMGIDLVVPVTEIIGLVVLAMATVQVDLATATIVRADPVMATTDPVVLVTVIVPAARVMEIIAPVGQTGLAKVAVASSGVLATGLIDLDAPVMAIGPVIVPAIDPTGTSGTTGEEIIGPRLTTIGTIIGITIGMG
jgi:hypothetical protein